MVGVGMVPGTLPAARLVGGTRGSVNGAVFLLGYCTLWLVLGLLGYVVLTPFSTALGEIGAGALLVAAAVYELSPLKDACLRRCRSPVRLLFHPSFAGGISHGLDCAGCCVFSGAATMAPSRRRSRSDPTCSFIVVRRSRTR